MDLSEREQRVFAWLQELKRRPEYRHWLLVKTGRRLFLLKVDEITWIEAQGNYVRLHHGAKSYLMRESLTALEGQLDPANFLRIHRSVIVRINQIRELQPWMHGEYRVILENGTQLMLTRNYRQNLQKVIGREGREP